MGGAAGDFSQRQPAKAPGDDVAGAGDIDRGVVLATADRARGEDLEQFRVQWSAVELKNEFGNFRTNGKHGYRPFYGSLASIRLIVTYNSSRVPRRAAKCTPSMGLIIVRHARGLQGRFRHEKK